GELGMKAVIANPACPPPDINEVIVWDIGGGSFQMSYMNELGGIKVYNGAFGASNFAQKIHESVGCDQNVLLNQQQLLAAFDAAELLLGSPINNYYDLANLKSHASGYVYAIGQLMNMGIKPMVKQEQVTIDQIYEMLIGYTDSDIPQ